MLHKSFIIILLSFT